MQVDNVANRSAKEFLLLVSFLIHEVEKLNLKGSLVLGDIRHN